MKKILVFAVGCCLLPALVMAKDVWQSDEAIGIVHELLESLNLIVEMSDEEQMQPDAVQSKNAHAALVDIRFLIDELEKMDLALAVGRGKAQTFAQYKKISNLRYSVRDYARDTEISEEIRVLAAAARRLLRKLDLMYI